jgi:hypothetical protein
MGCPVSDDEKEKIEKRLAAAQKKSKETPEEDYSEDMDERSSGSKEDGDENYQKVYNQDWIQR